MNYSKISCEKFTEMLASDSPVPGGGGASACAGAVGIALGNMVGSLTIGKKKYEAVEADIILLMKKAEAIRQELLELIDKDAEVFEPLARAYKLSREEAADGLTAEKRAEIMEAALKAAAIVPLRIMDKCGEAIELLKEFAAKGTKTAVSDAGCGAVLCGAALQSASLNVFINTKSMTDREYAGEINQKANSLLERYIPMADEIYAFVRKQLA